MITLLLGLLLGGQDDLDARLEALAPALAADDASVRLRDLCSSLPGREALREAIRLLVDHKAGRLDRDPQGAFEDHYFSSDATGALRLRPERAAAFEALAQDVAAAHLRMGAFNRRAFALAGRIAGDGELEKRARAWWTDSTFRIAYYFSRADELREPEAPAILLDLLRRPEELEGLAVRLERIRDLQPSYLKLLAPLNDDARRDLVTERAAIFILGRLLRQIDDGEENPLGKVEENELSFNVPLPELIPPLREAVAQAAELALPADWNEGTRWLAVERVLAEERRRKVQADGVFAEIIEDGFVERDGKLAVKPGRYEGDDPGAALDAEHQGVVDGFRAARAPFDLTAGHCADPRALETFLSPVGTLVLREHMERTVAELRRSIEERGFDLFTRLYLEQTGERFAVRPEFRAGVVRIGVRAAELKRDGEKRP